MLSFLVLKSPCEVNGLGGRNWGSEKLGKACDGNLELIDPNIYV